jgi:sigma-B regulation protein RsbU (phosphoserine phosphatase)
METQSGRGGVRKVQILPAGHEPGRIFSFQLQISMRVIMTPQVTIQTPDGIRKTISLQQSQWSLGRSAENDFFVAEDAGISRHHLRLEFEGENWEVVDLGSKNGTYVNGVRVQGRQRLQPGDRIVASRLLLTFGSAPPAAPECSVVFERHSDELLSENSISTSLDQLISERRPVPRPLEPARIKQWKTPLDAFLRAGRELSLGRSIPELFEVILDLSIEAVGAERGVLMTLENGNLQVQASRGESFRISTTVRDKVLKEKASLLLQDAQNDEAFRGMQSIVAQSVHTLIAVPLQTDNQVIGLIYVDTQHMIHHFTSDDLDLLTAMANVAALRIERERMVEIEQSRRRMAVELSQAAEIQRQFLPAVAPQISGLELAGFNVSCRTVGGDYYDYIPLSHGRAAVMVGDVCGKGMPAALLMMGLQARVRVLAEILDSPHELAERLNRILTAAGLNDRFITLFYAIYNPATQELDYCNAGHNPPLLVRVDGKSQWLEGGGPVLGLLPEIAFEERTVLLQEGDTVLLYSDGVTEANNPAGEEFGEERLGESLLSLRFEPAQSILQGMIQTVQNWMNGVPPADDLTLVVVQKPSESAGK